jgi:general L-amino acid transport system substrate-binding protein
MIQSTARGFSTLCLLATLAWTGFAYANDCQNHLAPTNPSSAYLDQSDGTITDTRSGLMWKQCVEGLGGQDCQIGSALTFDWPGALNHAQTHEFAGYSDWRVPNIRELRSLLERCRAIPAINSNVFPNSPSEWLWSSSPSADNPAASWYVDFALGESRSADRTQHHQVRLVRGGPDVPPVSVIFDGTGGTAPPNLSGKPGMSIRLPSIAPVREGHEFLGWTIESDSSNTLLGLGTILIFPSQDQRLISEWKINRYTLTFDTDGGSSVHPIVQDFGATVILPGNPVRVGYRFIGWSPAVPSKVPAEDLSFKAIWEPDLPTLQAIKDRGFLICGVSRGLPGFSEVDEGGNWRGMDVDTCRGMAAAILGDANAIRFEPLFARERFAALQSAGIDVLSRNTTWTLSRDASLGLHFTGVNFHDGQGFMVRRSLDITNPLELDGSTFCIHSTETAETNLFNFFTTNGMDYQPIVSGTLDEALQAFEENRCDVVTSDISQLAALRTRLNHSESAILLSQLISKEPLGPVVRQGDDHFFNVIKWVLMAQINAEELGVTSENVDHFLDSDDLAIQRLLGTFGNDLGQPLGLESSWAYNIIRQVGNYGEMFERNLGLNTNLGLPRGMNALWSEGGILFAPPIR